MAIGDDILNDLGFADPFDDDAKAKVHERIRAEALAEMAERDRQSDIVRRALDNEAGRAFLALIERKLRWPTPRDGLSVEQYAVASAEHNGQLALLATIRDMLEHNTKPRNEGAVA